MEKKPFNKKILLAVDESENARRAVSYVAQLLGGVKGFRVKILHIIPGPESDYFASPDEERAWLIQYKENTDRLLEEYRQMLIHAGFHPVDVTVQSILRYSPSLVESILEERDKHDFSTIVVGRHGLSRREEFLFGSISNRIVSQAQDCTIWVVE